VTEGIDVKNGSRRYFGLMRKERTKCQGRCNVSVWKAVTKALKEAILEA
jgi:hypothetical protein